MPNNRVHPEHSEKSLEQLQEQVGEIKSLMQDNIWNIIEREEKLDVLYDRAQQLEVLATQFAKCTNYCLRQQKTKFYKRKEFIALAASSSVGTLIIILIALI